MRSPATSSSATLGATASVDTPAISQYESDNPPDCLPAKQSAFTQDFYLDTFFNPIWMSSPNVFSFAKDGTVVRPQTYATEPYPGYHADHTRHLESANASYFEGFARGDPKLWEDVVIVE